MKALNIILLIVGIVLLLATESESATTNFIGLALVIYGCDKLNLFNNGGNDSGTIVAKEQ